MGRSLLRSRGSGNYNRKNISCHEVVLELLWSVGVGVGVGVGAVLVLILVLVVCVCCFVCVC